MDRYRVEKGDNHAYLCTCSVANWLPIFNAGPQYADVVLDSLKFCRQRKGLILHGYVLMIDHLHLIVRHPDLPGLMRDFKSWTAKAITETLEQNKRHELLAVLKSAATQTAWHQDLKVWQDGYHPKAISSDAMMQQKLDYIHANPVRKGFVGAVEDWKWSSARNYFRGDHSVLEIDLVAPLIV
jgi:REP element-mobilizing transposase RayT